MRIITIVNRTYAKQRISLIASDKVGEAVRQDSNLKRLKLVLLQNFRCVTLLLTNRVYCSLLNKPGFLEYLKARKKFPRDEPSHLA